MMADLFERLNKEQPKFKVSTINSELAQKPPLAQTLLDWLQRWNKPTISTRDICQFGPRSIRDRKNAIIAAEILAVHGWLIPLKMRQYNAHKWQIVRRPIVYPAVATETVKIDPSSTQP